MTAARPPVILAFGPNPWHGPWMNRQQLLSRLGRFGPVVYTMGAPQPGRRKVPRAGLNGGLLPVDNIWIDLPPAWLLRPTRFAWFRDLMSACAARRWRALASELGTGPLIGYVFHPKFWPEVKDVRADLLVYHAYDFYHLQGRGAYVFDEYERAIVKAADVVIASSAPIADRLRSLGAARVHIVENAADYDAFAKSPDPSAPVPEDLLQIPSPRIGYTGALNRKVDFPLLLELAQRMPRCHFVLIGRVGDIDDAGMRAVQQLQALPNVHFVGFKDREQLPAYMAAMDVNVMAYRLGDDVWTEGIYPLKLHEYLAVGQPVVSTDLPAVRPFADVIRIAVSPADWELALNEALEGRGAGSLSARRTRASLNSWDARVRQIRALLPYPDENSTTGARKEGA